MAHQLLTEDGKAAMFYVDKEPWHGLGTNLNAPPTSEEAIVAANLDWGSSRLPSTSPVAIISTLCRTDSPSFVRTTSANPTARS
jgi:hypothetical protein